MHKLHLVPVDVLPLINFLASGRNLEEFPSTWAVYDENNKEWNTLLNNIPHLVFAGEMLQLEYTI